MENNVLSLLTKQMEDEKTSAAASLIEGGAKTLEEYREVCGKIYGLNVAQRIVGEMKARLQQQDE